MSSRQYKGVSGWRYLHHSPAPLQHQDRVLSYTGTVKFLSLSRLEELHGRGFCWLALLDYCRIGNVLLLRLLRRVSLGAALPPEEGGVYRNPSSGLARRLIGWLLAESPGASFNVLRTAFRSPSLLAISWTSMARICGEPPPSVVAASQSLLTILSDHDCRLGVLS
jgi:hypothetical protein